MRKVIAITAALFAVVCLMWVGSLFPAFSPDQQELRVQCAGGTIHNSEIYNFCDHITGTTTKDIATRWACRCMLAQALCRADDEEVISRPVCVSQGMMSFMRENNFPNDVDRDESMLYPAMKQVYDDAIDTLIKGVRLSRDLKGSSRKKLAERAFEIYESDLVLLGYRPAEKKFVFVEKDDLFDRG